MREAERYRLDTVVLTSTHGLDSETSLLGGTGLRLSLKLPLVEVMALRGYLSIPSACCLYIGVFPSGSEGLFLQVQVLIVLCACALNNSSEYCVIR